MNGVNKLPDDKSLSAQQLLSELTGVLTQNQIDHMFAYGICTINPAKNEELELHIDSAERRVTYKAQKSKPIPTCSTFLGLCAKTLLGPSWSVAVETLDE